MSRLFITALLATTFGTTACDSPQATGPMPTPAFDQAPADGHGNKLVFTFDITSPISCGTVTITRRVKGWTQIKTMQDAGKNVEIDIFHATTTFSNEAGGTYTFRSVDADRYWLEGDRLLVALHGRTPWGALGHTFIGILTLDVETGEVVAQHGLVTDLPKIPACEALT